MEVCVLSYIVKQTCECVCMCVCLNPTCARMRKLMVNDAQVCIKAYICLRDKCTKKRAGDK